jgi:hypothetical protein
VYEGYEGEETDAEVEHGAYVPEQVFWYCIGWWTSIPRTLGPVCPGIRAIRGKRRMTVNMMVDARGVKLTTLVFIAMRHSICFRVERRKSSQGMFTLENGS